MNLAQALIGDVGVYLRRCDRGMAEHALHRADVGTAAQKIGGERVAQGVRRHLYGDAGGARIMADQPLNRAGRERFEDGAFLDRPVVARQ